MKIELCIGPMRSGKSKDLIEMYQHLVDDCGYSVRVIKPTMDSRDVGIVKSRASNLSVKAYPPSETIKGLYVDAVMVDEAQFLSDLEIDNLLSLKVQTLYFYGLSSDYHGNMFPAITRLIPMAHHIKVLTAKCDVCAEPATHSKLLTEGHGKTVIIGDSEYSSVCRKHFYD